MLDDFKIKKKRVSELPVIQTVTEDTVLMVVEDGVNYQLNINDIPGGGGTGDVTKSYVDQQDVLRVPYAGATSNIDLNEKAIINIDSVSLVNGETILWDVDENSLSYTLPDGGNIAIGKEMFDYYTNIDSVTLVNGDVVSIFPISGNRKGIKRTDFTSAPSVKNMIGMVTVPTILVNTIGRITTVGEVHELNTDLYNEGTQIYGDAVNPGKWTSVEPDAPNYAVIIGSIVVKHQNVGIVHLQLTKTCKLNELADVNGTEPTTGSILVYNQTLGVHDFTAKVSDFSQTGHTHDDRYYTESEITTLLSSKSDTSHLHNGVYSSLSMNVLTAGAGATEYTLLRNIQTNILNTLPSGVNSTITLPASVAGELNESVLHFSTGSIIPTLVYNGFTPVWLGGTTLSLKINKTYTVCFEQVRTSTGVWIVKTSWGEY